MAHHRLLIVSNRLPVSVSRQNGTLTFAPSSGGLATAMGSLPNDHGEKLWIGWPGISSDELRPGEKTLITKKLRTMGCAPVFLSSSQIELFYNGYANGTLWPLFHYFQSLASYRDETWAAYQEVNALFTEATAAHARANATIWVHDYHLMLVPQLLRGRLPLSTIGFFLHTPFPSYELFRLLPDRTALLKGLLGADLIGFHIYDYARHFLSSTLRILGIDHHHGALISDARLVKVDAFPIGIDVVKFRRSVQSKKVGAEKAAIAKRYRGQKIILSVDRLDYSKGILKRLEAYELFLQTHPHRIGLVTLVMIAVPSRTEVESYQQLRQKVEETVSRINGIHGTIGWAPIAYQFRNLPFEQTVALYSLADVALVTPLRDGMNLVAKEYIASRKTDGVLILSEMAGASDELTEALHINPNDSRAISQAIEAALMMPVPEQQARLQAMKARIASYTVQDWARDFIEQLTQNTQPQTSEDALLLTSAAEIKVRRAFVAAKRRLILLDYDGTLRGFVPTPDPAAAAPPAATVELLTRLAAHPSTTVAIISGRSKPALEAWFKRLPLTLAAEHGAWIKTGKTWVQQQANFRAHRSTILKILRHYAARTPGARVEEKDFALVWHYRTVAPELAFMRNVRLRSELEQLLEHTDIGIFSGAKVIEIKPRAVNKGAVSQSILAASPADFILAIGDDYTDEDMFKALPQAAYTIKVGLGDTTAKHRVGSVEYVHELLKNLSK